MSSEPPRPWPPGSPGSQWSQEPVPEGPSSQQWTPVQSGWPGQAPADQPDWLAQGGWPSASPRMPPKPSLPVVATRYHGFWRTPRWALWKPILGLVIGIGGYLLLSLLLSLLALLVDSVTGRIGIAEHAEQLRQGGGLTPSLFIFNNLSLAACILLAWAVGGIHGQRPGWMSSVVGHFRWRWFFSCIGWLLPLWVLMTLVSSFVPALSGDGSPLEVNRDTWVMLAGVLLTTPLQCVGEEFGFRGLLNRAVASVVAQDSKVKALISALLGGAVSSVFFMFAHSAEDPWLNVFYFCFGAIACYLCHVSGGLEASSAMHIVNNMSSMVFLPFTDFSKLFDRSEGTGSPWGLVQLAVVVAGAAIITWRVRRKGIVAVAAPAAHDQGLSSGLPAAGAGTGPGPRNQGGALQLPAPSAVSGPTSSAETPSGPDPAAGRHSWRPTAPPIGSPWDADGRPWAPDKPSSMPTGDSDAQP